jgi:beta-lactamase superfamily II metal-dependent hydrolase
MVKTKRSELRITIFDVGFGDHILLEFPNGSVGIVDSCIPPGLDEPPALKRLRQIRKERHLKKPLEIKFLCITHPHDDHVNGIMQIIDDQDFEVKQIWHSVSSSLDFVIRQLNGRKLRSYKGAEPISSYFRAHSPTRQLLEALRYAKKHKKLIPLVEFRDFRDVMPIGDVKIKCLSPCDKAVTRYIKRIEKDIECNGNKAVPYANRISLVLHLSYGNKRILLSSDAVRANWREMMRKTSALKFKGSLFPVHVIKAPHHGSTNTYYKGLWDIILRKNALIAISAGGALHPNANFIRSLPEKGRCYCTNFGQCEHFPSLLYTPIVSQYPGDEFIEFVNNKCCGNIKITIPAEGRIKVTTDSNPVCKAKATT